MALPFLVSSQHILAMNPYLHIGCPLRLHLLWLSVLAGGFGISPHTLIKQAHFFLQNHLRVQSNIYWRWYPESTSTPPWTPRVLQPFLKAHVQSFYQPETSLSSCCSLGIAHMSSCLLYILELDDAIECLLFSVCQQSYQTIVPTKKLADHLGDNIFCMHYKYAVDILIKKVC